MLRPCCCVQVADAGDTSEGGILLTTGSKEQPTLGKVRACMQQPPLWHLQSTSALSAFLSCTAVTLHSRRYLKLLLPCLHLCSSLPFSTFAKLTCR